MLSWPIPFALESWETSIPKHRTCLRWGSPWSTPQSSWAAPLNPNGSPRPHSLLLIPESATEEFFCNFEVNPEYEWAAMEAGFPVVARGPNGEIRAIESPTHRFFIATLFQPQLSSKPGHPHPLVLAFLQAAADWGKKRLDDSVLG